MTARVVAVVVVVALAPAASRAASAPRLWQVGVLGGPSWYVGVGDLRAVLGVTVSRTLWRYMEVGLLVRVSPNPDDLQLDLVFRSGARLAWRRLVATAAISVGYSAVHTDPYEEGGVWTESLLLQPALGMGVVVHERLEVRAEVLTATFMYHRFWMAAWEPSLIVLYRF